MAIRLSNAQVDKLGERLKSDPISDDDLRMLDEFRHSFEIAFAEVIRTLTSLGFQHTGRSKTNDSIIAKLRRGEVKLSGMQDLVGCRACVSSFEVQNRSIALISTAFPGSKRSDKRNNPRNGYRAVHLIPKIQGKAVEIQVRTVLQDAWASLCEKLADYCDAAIKYGGGPPASRMILDKLSEAIKIYERYAPDLKPPPPRLPFRPYRAFRAFKFGLRTPSQPNVIWSPRERELLFTAFGDRASELIRQVDLGANEIEWGSFLRQLQEPLSMNIEVVRRTSEEI